MWRLENSPPTDRKALKLRAIGTALYEQKWCVCMHDRVTVCTKRKIIKSMIVCVCVCDAHL